MRSFSRKKPCSWELQVKMMAQHWPGFQFFPSVTNDYLLWKGTLRPLQKTYTVGVLFKPAMIDRPYVYLIDPPLRPRDSGTYKEIPHLIYNEGDPEFSGLCLFDPARKEWSDHMLIAKTTVPWASKWLYYYELWHYDGKWRGGGIGPESAALAEQEVVHGATKEYTPDSKGKITLAIQQTIQDTLP